jgi:LmbE family N-acetylglucosaminyl deacetylase
MSFNPEHVLIPFDVSPLPPGPWLVFAPHADDETFGMGGSLLRAKAEGIETHLVVVTDGALGGTRDDLVGVRKQEIETAAKMLGFASLELWLEPDRGVCVTAQLLTQTCQELDRCRPNSVFFPGPLEIHPDHRATGHLVWQAIQQSLPKHPNLKAYAYEISVQNPINLCIDVGPMLEQKKAVMDVYASQNSENNYPELVIALDKGRTFSMPESIQYAEGFYRFSEEELQLSLAEATRVIIERYLPQIKN